MISTKELKVIGLSIRTTNKESQAVQDIGNLWKQFIAENIIKKIPNKISDHIYAIYTDYENNYKGDYTAIIGVEVTTIDDVPEGLVGRVFEGGFFKKFLAKGTLPNSLAEVWNKIWQNEDWLDRKYTYDYELYTEKSYQADQSEVEIYISVN